MRRQYVAFDRTADAVRNHRDFVLSAQRYDQCDFFGAFRKNHGQRLHRFVHRFVASMLQTVGLTLCEAGREMLAAGQAVAGAVLWASGKEAGSLVEVGMGLAAIEGGDELAPDKIGFADAEAEQAFAFAFRIGDGLHLQA